MALRCKISAALLVFGWWMVGPTWAQDHIVADEADAPYSFADHGQPSGLYPALVTEVYRELREPLLLEAWPWRRVLQSLDDGEVGAVGVYKNLARSEKYDFSAPLYQETILVYINKAHPVPFHGLASLAGRTIGVLDGWSYGDAFDAAARSGQIHTEAVATDQQNFDKLLLGRLDAVLAVQDESARILDHPPYDGTIAAIGQPFLVNSAYLAFAKSRHRQAFLTRFNAAMAALQENGRYDSVIATITRASQPFPGTMRHDH